MQRGTALRGTLLARVAAAGVLASLVGCTTTAVPTQTTAATPTPRASATAPPATASPIPVTPTANPDLLRSEGLGVAPYKIRRVGGPIQELGTIIVGTPIKGGVSPFVGYPHGSFSIDLPHAFGAFWGKPVGAREIAVALHRRAGITWRLVWSDAKAIDAKATGFTGLLPRFRQTGMYVLVVAARGEVLAASLLRMVPPCVRNCSGG